MTLISTGSNPESALYLGPGSKVHMKKSALLTRAGPVTIKRASEIGVSVPFRVIGLSGAELTLEDISLEGGLLLLSSSYGGGIDVFESIVTLLRSRVSGNTAPEGGGISLRSASASDVNRQARLILSNSTITGNTATATNGGSGIWASHVARVRVTITGTSFLHGNTPPQSCASGSGWTGQILDQSTLSCSDCEKGKWSTSSTTQGICVFCPSKFLVLLC